MAQNTREIGSPLLPLEGKGIPPLSPLPTRKSTLLGLPPTANPLVLIGHLTRAARTTGPIVVITRSDADAESLVGDLRGLGRLTGAVDPGGVAIFPALSADPYDGLAPHLSVVCERLRALWRLRQGSTRVVVIPAAALLVPLPPASLLDGHFVVAREAEPLPQA